MFKFLLALLLLAVIAAPWMPQSSFLFDPDPTLEQNEIAPNDAVGLRSVLPSRFVPYTSRTFVSIIAALFAVGMLQLMYNFAKMRGFAGTIPGHLTAIGILGTFIGIFLGLFSFDTTDLNASVANLLEGMKLAFTTSIAGLTASTALRVSHSIVVSITEDDPWHGGDDGTPVVIVPGMRENVVLMLKSTVLTNTLVKQVKEIQASVDAINSRLKKSSKPERSEPKGK